MAGDGMKTNRIAKTKRNKWGQVVVGITGAVATIEQQMPGVLPPGTGLVAGQLGAIALLLINNLVRS